MGMMVLGLGAALCGGGAAAHFSEKWRRSETGLALGGFCLMLAALFMSHAGHF